MATPSYAQALAYIYSLTDYERQAADLYSPDRFNLERMHRLLAAIGDPHRRFHSLHIAGTKGKGSTAAMSEQVLREAGYHTGLFTSPHLHTFRERIRLDGQLIPEGAVVEGLDVLRPHVPAIPGLTTFELITALGFWAFARQGVDVAVVEVGLGGRLDATNVVTPLVSVITSLSYDHTAILGNTLAAIACEKAGIIKPNVPVVSAPQAEEALVVIEAISQERDAPLTLVGRDWTWQSQDATWQGQSFTAGPRSAAQEVYRIPLTGHHQVVNATVTLAAMGRLREQGLTIPQASLGAGLWRVKWPGRLEVLSRRPWVVVDGAHNRASAEELRRALTELFPYRRMVLIFATYQDKDIPGMLEALLPLAHEVIVSRFDSPRAVPTARLRAQAEAMGAEATEAEDVGQALVRAGERASADDLICVAGSVRFAGEARLAWARMSGQPLPPADPPLPS